MLPRFLSPGPLFALEMVTSVRRARYFVVRVLYAAVLLLLLWNVYQVINQPYNSANDVAAVAQFSWIYFSYFSMLQLLAVVVAGPAMAAGAIAAERERRTIEYLFATTLTNAEIVFGKLLARLMHLGYLVLVGMPILSIAMLMGGIAPQAIVVLMIVTISTALTVSIISITVSVWTPRARDAVVRAYLVIIVLLLLPPLMIAMRFSNYYGYIAPLNEQFLMANPFYTLGNILVTASSSKTAAAWDMLFDLVRNQAIVCFLGITASTLAVRRVHLSARAGKSKKRRRRLLAFRPAMGDRPMLWKEIVAEPMASRLGFIGRIAMMLIVIGVLTPTICVFYYSVFDPPKYISSGIKEYLEYAYIMGAVIGSGGLLLTAARAAGLITSEKERDCWVSLISSPMEPSEIVLDKIIGNLWAARGVAIMLAIIWGLGLLADPGFIIPVAFMAGSFLLLAVFASALGVMYSLWCRTSMRAIAATLATGLFLGGLYLFCCIPLFIMSGPNNSPEIMLSGCVPFLLGFPGYAYVSDIFHHVTVRPANYQSNMFATYVMGTIGYAFASWVLIAAGIRNFDRFTGRTRPAPWDLSLPHRSAVSNPAHPLTQLSEEIIRAEIVEEP